MLNPLDLFSSIKSAAITIGAVACLTLIGTLWVQKNIAEKSVETLTAQKAALESAVLSKQIEVNGLKASIDILESTVSKIDENKAIEAENNKEIDNASPDQDGPVAPVLRNALRGIERMYSHKP